MKTQIKICHICKSKKSRKWYKDFDKIICSSCYQKKRYRINPSKTIKRSHKYYWDNKEKILNRKKKAYYANRDKFLKIHAEYRKNHKEDIKQAKKTFRYRYVNFKGAYNKRGTKRFFSMSFKIYEKLLEKGCSYCGRSLKHETGIGLDRLNNNKGYTKSNVVPCCGICNQAKSDVFTYKEMKKIGKVIKNIFIARDKEKIKYAKI
jgi:hypothetical protein